MKIHHIVPTLFCCLLVTACSSKSTVPNQPLAADSSAQSHRVITRLLDYYTEWQGVPHCNGGMSKEGVDGSGFTYLAFRDSFDVRLPHSTSQMANSGTAISKIQLKPGDLIFFKVDMGTRHVGIYVEDKKFIHASKSTGVMISRMDNPYWQKHYWQARRMTAL